MRNALTALVLFLTFPAQAQEVLRLFPPAGFAGVHVSQAGGIRLVEYVADGQTLADWSDALTVAELRGTGMGATDLVARLQADLTASCSGAFSLDPDVAEIDGRTATLSIHACPNADISGRPEMDLLRVIEGKDVLFAVQRSWVVSPPTEELARWTDWLRDLRVCDADGC
ncbi:hypothetical protein [Jannaschia rubra]|uniref:Uncharacterized protein n=1 Tax=Jannaschia rubra TaxID=282197 RepID=A0A0M6XND0_9RHOB|nr:hypothetical protein [Jannaschia rubra]CTQ31534.1 hypothetical protein JAN5088_00292 [Jannaschia rubra]SFF77670.1 hypothetical protein SAMN04488517_101125 [Jannaschia rubra]